MTTKVHLFARARDLAGTDTLAVPITIGATVGDLRAAIVQKCPALREILPRCAVAVNEDFADDDLNLPMHAQVAVIPPVSGGAR
jgi:molybdopterin converting factor subunit 1